MKLRNMIFKTVNLLIHPRRYRPGPSDEWRRAALLNSAVWYLNLIKADPKKYLNVLEKQNLNIAPPVVTVA
jgi:hypothetical protein